MPLEICSDLFVVAKKSLHSAQPGRNAHPHCGTGHPPHAGLFRWPPPQPRVAVTTEARCLGSEALAKAGVGLQRARGGSGIAWSLEADQRA